MMNSLLKKLQDFPEQCFHKYSPDTGKTLTHLGALGWVLSSLAQTTMIVTNKDIDPKEKKFLVPQEITDGVVNVGLYYTICSGIKKAASYIIEKGLIITPETDNAMRKIKNLPVPVHEFVKGFTEDLVDLGVITKKESKKPLTAIYENMHKFFKAVDKDDTFLKEAPGYIKEFSKKYSRPPSRKSLLNTLNSAYKELGDYKGFANGVGVVATVAASILASSIITPIVRNKIAGKLQKRLNNTDFEAQKLPISQNPLPKSTDLNMFNYEMPPSSAFTVFNKPSL